MHCNSMADCKNDSVVYNPVYTEEQERLITNEFSRIRGECYLEHAGATLYSEKQLSNIFSELSTNTYGNPHAQNKSSKFSGDIIDQIRFKILQHFNTNSEEYSIIFTSGSTAALKLVGESFQYGPEGTFVYLQDNHTSVLGMREYASNVITLDRNRAFEVFDNNYKRPSREVFSSNSLFVYPAECNFSGTKYPLSWIQDIQNGCLQSIKGAPYNTKWFCMLDAACYVSTNFLDLNQYKPDFVCMSFYKMFGYPSGLGALLVKNTSEYVLEKIYFGGGTVVMALAAELTHVLRPTLHERFEDGTLPFLSIIALRHGFEAFQRFSITMDKISKHTFNLARFVFHTLKSFCHANGEPVAILYHDGNYDDINQQGGIVTFNILRPNGRYIGYSEVMHVSNLYGIHLRTGCFCNTGACQRHLKLSTEDVKHHFNAGHICGDQNDLIDGYPTGSVRISFGYMSTKREADTFLQMISEYFVTKPVVLQTLAYNQNNNTTIRSKNEDVADHNGVLKKMFIYPVKSCAAYTVQKSWKIVNTGLQYDRQWMIINSNGVAVTQKTDTRLTLIKPQILVKQGLLQLSYEGLPNTSVPLNMTQHTIIPSLHCQSKVCRDRVQGLDCGDAVAEWLIDALGIPGLRLLQQYNEEYVRKYKKDDSGIQLSLSNEAQFLLINIASVQWLLDHIATDDDFEKSVDNIVARFRPNFLVDFSHPFVENSFSRLQIGQLTFSNEGMCTRCQMICINQSTGEKTIEPLRTLSKLFNGKIQFGVYLNNASCRCSILSRNESVSCYITSNSAR